MFILIACIFFLLSVSGLIVSMLRLKEYVLGDVSNAKLEAVIERLITFEWIAKLPNDALLLVAVFLIASVLSLRAILRTNPSSRSAANLRYRQYPQ